MEGCTTFPIGIILGHSCAQVFANVGGDTERDCSALFDRIQKVVDRALPHIDREDLKDRASSLVGKLREMPPLKRADDKRGLIAIYEDVLTTLNALVHLSISSPEPLVYICKGEVGVPAPAALCDVLPLAEEPHDGVSLFFKDHPDDVVKAYFRYLDSPPSFKASPELLVQLLHLATQIDHPITLKVFADLLIDQIGHNIELALAILSIPEIGTTKELETVYKRAIQALAFDIKATSAHPKFLELPSLHVRALFDSGYMWVDSESEVLEVMIAWALNKCHGNHEGAKALLRGEPLPASCSHLPIAEEAPFPYMNFLRFETMKTGGLDNPLLIEWVGEATVEGWKAFNEDFSRIVYDGEKGLRPKITDFLGVRELREPRSPGRAGWSISKTENTVTAHFSAPYARLIESAEYRTLGGFENDGLYSPPFTFHKDGKSYHLGLQMRNFWHSPRSISTGPGAFHLTPEEKWHPILVLCADGFKRVFPEDFEITLSSPDTGTETTLPFNKRWFPIKFGPTKTTLLSGFKKEEKELIMAHVNAAGLLQLSVTIRVSSFKERPDYYDSSESSDDE